jgi:hypothetical protein
MTELSELHDRTADYRPPGAPSSRPGDPQPAPEPWSHPWHDQLGLRYHQAIAEKIRRQPTLLTIATENLRRWNAVDPDKTPSPARRRWQEILEHQPLEEILRLMTDPTEEGHRRRQSTPFAGILSSDERRAIRDQLLRTRHDPITPL